MASLKSWTSLRRTAPFFLDSWPSWCFFPTYSLMISREMLLVPPFLKGSFVLNFFELSLGYFLPLVIDIFRGMISLILSYQLSILLLHWKTKIQVRKICNISQTYINEYLIYHFFQRWATHFSPWNILCGFLYFGEENFSQEFFLFLFKTLQIFLGDLSFFWTLQVHIFPLDFEELLSLQPF